MTFKAIKERVMFQTNNDADDLGDFAPHIDDYVNEGYDALIFAEKGARVGNGEYPALAADNDEPNIPGWTHSAIANYATWLIYRNGNPLKQQRGMVFNAAFVETYNKVKARAGQPIKFINMY